MITNANRSGSVKAEPLERIIPTDENRSGSVSEHATKEEPKNFGSVRPKKIIEVDGQRRLVAVDKS
jgi:hypothetical protein